MFLHFKKYVFRMAFYYFNELQTTINDFSHVIVSLQSQSDVSLNQK